MVEKTTYTPSAYQPYVLMRVFRRPETVCCTSCDDGADGDDGECGGVGEDARGGLEMEKYLKDGWAKRVGANGIIPRVSGRRGRAVSLGKKYRLLNMPGILESWDCLAHSRLIMSSHALTRRDYFMTLGLPLKFLIPFRVPFSFMQQGPPSLPKHHVGYR